MPDEIEIAISPSRDGARPSMRQTESTFSTIQVEPKLLHTTQSGAMRRRAV